MEAVCSVDRTAGSVFKVDNAEKAAAYYKEIAFSGKTIETVSASSFQLPASKNISVKVDSSTAIAIEVAASVAQSNTAFINS